MHDPDALARRGLEIIERGLRKYEWTFPYLLDDMRSEAHTSLALAIPRILAHPNPGAYLAVAATNAFRHVLRRNRLERRHHEPAYWEGMEDFAPRPETVAMFREEMGQVTNHSESGYHLHASEWAIFKAIVAEYPQASNREIAIRMNRKTGRKFDVYATSRARRRLAI